jgi:hypothetical protein
MADQGRGSNLTDEDRSKGGQNSGQSQSSQGDKGGSSTGQGKGNFGNSEQHAEAGRKGGSK